MKITIAENSGFCFGVQRALDIVSTLKEKDVYILGQLIHNPQVVRELDEKGIRIVEDVDGISKGTIVISAHGVPDSVINKAKSKNLKIIDTTCPLVKKVHNIAKKMEADGKTVIIFGDKDHTEVKGIRGNLSDSIIISDIRDIGRLKKDGNYGLVPQTTQSIETFNDLVEKLKNFNIEIQNTICEATKRRQSSTEMLARNSDLMIVIGGYNSANTRRLAQLCDRLTETKHIESVAQLKREWFGNKQNIGITAGASTPLEIIKEIKNKILFYVE